MDQFFTPDEVAKTCINLIPNIEQYDLIIEPSAGAGAFSKYLSCIAYDIEPLDNNIICQDYFTVTKPQCDHLLVIGNPPFGSRSSLAKKFIKHSIFIGAETIGFILPETFSKLSNQSITLFPKEWRLIIDTDIKNTNFILPNGDKYHVPCRFYVWTKQPGDYNLRKRKLLPTKDFIFLNRGDLSADFTINGNTGKIKNLSEVTNSKAEHYIKAGEKTKEELIFIFSNIKYNWYSSVNGGNSWISQQEILEAYYNNNNNI